LKAELKKKPRIFDVNDIEYKDFGKIILAKNEMVSLLSDNGNEIDITAKSWGYYLGPSLNARLVNEGYKAALVINQYNKIFIMVVDKAKIEEFKSYLKDNQGHRILCWLDQWFQDEL